MRKIPSVNEGSKLTHVIPFSSLLKKSPGFPFKFLESYNCPPIPALPSTSSLIVPSLVYDEGCVDAIPTVPNPVTTNVCT